MEQQKSDFQIKYSLSVRKKFWKKLIISILPLFIVYSILGGIIGFIASFIGLVTGSITNNMANVAAANTIHSGVTGFIYVFIVGIILSCILFLVIIILRVWYIKAYIKRYYYSADQNFLTIKKGVFAPREIHVQYQKIQDVYVDQDILDRIMGLYDVHIASATVSSGMEAHIDGVSQQVAEGLKDYLLNSIKFGYNNVPANVGASIPSAPDKQSRGPVKVSFTEEISSNKYPLTNKWIASEIISNILGSFIWTAIIYIWIGRAFLDGFSPNGYDFGTLIFWVLVVIVLIVAFRLIGLALFMSKYKFEFNQEFIYYRTGVIAISEKHIPYNTVQDVNIKQGIIDRMFGLADVMIENAAQAQFVPQGRYGTKFAFQGVTIQGVSLADANHITDVLRGILLTKNPQNTGL